MPDKKVVNKYQRDLKRTQSTFSDDPVINRANQIRRDDDNIKTPAVDLDRIDTALKWFVENRINPKVNESGTEISVPIMYANPETWTSIQRQGFIRDRKGKLLIPLIAFRRTSMTPRADIPRMKLIDDTSNKILFRKKYSNQNRYDNFSTLQLQWPQVEYYSMDIPDYVNVEYEMIIWCEYTLQLNHLVEQIIHWQGTAWGETYKFMTTGESYSFETVNPAGEDRIVKANISLKMQAHLSPIDSGQKSNLQKHFSAAKLILGSETVVDINNLPNKT